MPVGMLTGGRDLRCGFSHHEFRLDGDFRRIFFLAFDPVQQALCRNLAHAVQGLTNSGQAWAVKGSARDVVKSHHGDVLGDTQPLLLNGADRSNGGHVVISKESREWLLLTEELFSKRIT